MFSPFPNLVSAGAWDHSLTFGSAHFAPVESPMSRSKRIFQIVFLQNIQIRLRELNNS